MAKARHVLDEAGFTREHVSCYVLVGRPGDSMGAAERRLAWVWDQAMMPFVMLYRGTGDHVQTKPWRQWARPWCRPAIIRAMMTDG